MNLLWRPALALGGVLLAAGTVATYHKTTTFQHGYPGVGMAIVETNERLADKVKANELPPALPPASAEGVLAVNAYKNVQVLGHISSGDFTRTMTAITLWVSPQQGCGYCHAPQRDAQGKVVVNEDGYPQADLAKMDSDELYAKVVARRMIQMTQHVNADWKQHVQATGVTCWTCHRGNNVPKNIWFDEAPDPGDTRAVGYKGGQNTPALTNGLSTLPTSFFRPFLAGEESIRVQSGEALPSGNRQSIKQAEWTYGLMTHMSNALGVNCTYCHNSRSWADWSQSPATRATAWYGIRMVRDLNNAYLEPLLATYPPHRLGPTGDAPKANCTTCHQGAYKPLLGKSMLTAYPVFAEPKPQPPKTADLPVDLGQQAGATALAAAAADAGATTLAAAAGGDGGAVPPPALLGDAGATTNAVGGADAGVRAVKNADAGGATPR